jgi:hypothetical protein
LVFGKSLEFFISDVEVLQQFLFLELVKNN